MISIPGAPIIGGDANPGVWTPDSVLIGAQQSKPFYSIDMTAATLDSRITYTGPEYITFGSASAFEFASENTWAVEYRNSVPAGRIELNHATSNLVTSISTSGITNTQRGTGWTEYRETASTGEHAQLLDFTAGVVTAQFVFRHIGRENLAFRAQIISDGVYSQIGINNGEISYQSPEFSRAEIISITDEIKVLTASFSAVAGTAMFCASDSVITNDDQPVYAGDTEKGFDLFFDGQIESGDISTSPIEINITGETYAAQSAVIDTSDAESITLVYKFGGSKTYKTPGNTFILPTAGKNWQRRLIKRIDFR
ncbi:hypothetical protein EH228_04460 [Erwinia endophytica]|uniref:hypothetical protein n=1 Tax=Erwinia endophytica TaxID=1563158 RepID=UPI001265E092|nr:hypothetical protein [Erwinia endophytica]KAB8312937.1 hypothetical protein EH228_04460 [Erwinia endophytica]